ncbi:hypothetical protein MA16_Dca026677 [Dendrobium catenatum]|uniref:Uncharacterized protein n=1 Tax=Dendrobium catenatum TaxID=906689 RepID=A0A2I0VA95_9ASPA|nr:hypothetical protein MA16_Dca026677 [Dendrobium catenatum]
MRNPIKIFDNIPNYYAQTNAGFSPDEKLILNGTSVEKEDIIGGMLCFYDRRKLELVSRMGISPHQSVVRCSLYPKIKISVPDNWKILLASFNFKLILFLAYENAISPFFDEWKFCLSRIHF